MERNSGKEDEWAPLFYGENTHDWHSYGKEKAGNAWKVKEGNLYLDASQKEEGKVKGGGDLLSNEEFEDFHLKLDWKIAAGGNSGVLFYVQEDPGQYGSSWQSGPEMQLLDNAGHPDGKIPKRRAGDLYDLIPAAEDAAKAVGEWNEVEIISRESTLNIFLNGLNVISTTLWGEGWHELILNSKFRDFPDFGTYRKGRIALQDHGDPVWFRNIRIRRL